VLVQLNFLYIYEKINIKRGTHFEERESAGMTMQFCRSFCMVSEHLQEHEGLFFGI
jgi:hypothetical protein